MIASHANAFAGSDPLRPAYYNENDPFAAAWLRELISAGLIAPGDVDERSICEVLPTDLLGYAQCHFFAGIGGWSYALRLAGWSDSRPVWTGSCPCQPFSAAGKRKGAEDERHLWPVFFRLIQACRPGTVFGEQVASADVIGRSAKPSKRKAREQAQVWLDGVFADLETAHYSCAAGDIPAAGIGAPHIRQRVYWMADTDAGRFERHGECNGKEERSTLAAPQRPDLGGCGQASRLGNSIEPRLEGLAGHGDDRHEPGRLDTLAAGSAAQAGSAGGVADADGGGECRRPAEQSRESFGEDQGRTLESGRCGVSGFWSRFDLIPCRDGKARRVEPGLEPLAYGAPARVGRLRGYGNAIVSEAAAEFIRAAREAIEITAERREC